jgi:hypothetical protein
MPDPVTNDVANAGADAAAALAAQTLKDTEAAKAAEAKANEGKTPEQLATEKKTADDAAAAKAAEVAKAAALPVEYKLTLPEKAAIDAGALERTVAFAKATNLSPEAAQHALNHANAEVAAFQARNMAAFETIKRETWVKEIQADKEFGGDKFEGTIIECKRAAEKFATEDERKALNESGWGNHPILVRIMTRIGRAMADDKPINGTAGGGAQPIRTADVMYGGTKAS